MPQGLIELHATFGVDRSRPDRRLPQPQQHISRRSDCLRYPKDHCDSGSAGTEGSRYEVLKNRSSWSYSTGTQ